MASRQQQQRHEADATGPLGRPPEGCIPLGRWGREGLQQHRRTTALLHHGRQLLQIRRNQAPLPPMHHQHQRHGLQAPLQTGHDAGLEALAQQPVQLRLGTRQPGQQIHGLGRQLRIQIGGELAERRHQGPPRPDAQPHGEPL